MSGWERGDSNIEMAIFVTLTYEGKYSVAISIVNLLFTVIKKTYQVNYCKFCSYIYNISLL